MISTPTSISVVLTSPNTSEARTVLRTYYDEIVSRYYGRQATDAEVDRVLAEEPSDDLQSPTGLFWVATDGTTAFGCAGLRFVAAGVGEVTRVFVASKARRRGVASRLLDEVENAARARGLNTLRLDTRADLVEARRLYARHGYQEVPAFNDDPYAEHWFAKSLA